MIEAELLTKHYGKTVTMSARTIGRIVGALFLLAYVVYLAGGALADAGPASTVVLSHVASHQTQISAGALLMLANSAAVVGIGVLIFPILRRHHQLSAYGYLAAQVVQGVMLAMGVVFLLLRIPLAQAHSGSNAVVLGAVAQAAQEANHYSFWIGMAAVGIGGLLLCRVLLRERLAPTILAACGLAGYAIFLAGAMLQILGHNVGVALSIPGGIFEITFGALLIAKGFPEGQTRDNEALTPSLPAALTATSGGPAT
ncbi:MAG: DUF4386 domain-containing protein [Streptosporangiaceae bacterium]|jgi:hypothetical protein|nr:hypothetical protein [Actinomycetota bacterium]